MGKDSGVQHIKMDYKMKEQIQQESKKVEESGTLPKSSTTGAATDYLHTAPTPVKESGAAKQQNQKVNLKLTTAAKPIGKKLGKSASNSKLQTIPDKSVDGAASGTAGSAYKFEQKLEDAQFGSDPFKSSNEIKRTFYVKDKIDSESALRDYGAQLVSARRAQQESRYSSR